jgi:hypothetical protein
VGFVVDKAVLGQVFSEYFGSPANLHSPISPSSLSPGNGMIGLFVAAAPSRTNCTPPPTVPNYLKLNAMRIIVQPPGRMEHKLAVACFKLVIRYSLIERKKVTKCSENNNPTSTRGLPTSRPQISIIPGFPSLNTFSFTSRSVFHESAVLIRVHTEKVVAPATSEVHILMGKLK